MNKKAQNIIEILLLACFVAILGFTVFSIYNNSNFKLAGLSKIKVKEQASVDLENLSPSQANDYIPYTPIETIGSLSLICWNNMSLDGFNDRLSSVTYAEINNAFNPLGNSGGPNLAQLANTLITDLNLGFDLLNPSYVTSNTLNTLVEILQVVSDPSYLVNDTAQIFILAFGDFLGFREVSSCGPH